ncbi:MAG: hypothetical protein ACXAD7_03470 [Candidatus Kariarchaeaceae archaeon]|jgi:hypothetical protein
MKNNLTSPMLILLLAVSINIAFTSVSAQIENHVPTWQVDENSEFVYQFANVAYNGTDTAPMGGYDEETQTEFDNGVLRAGNRFYVRIDDLPDLTTEETEVRLSLRGSETPEWWDHSYDYNQSAEWSEEFDGPFLFMPISSVPENTTQWEDIEDMWNAVPGMSALYDTTYNEFLLQGSNSTLNITEFKGIWDTTSGVMKYYKIDFLEGDEYTPFAFEMVFLYFRDPSEWDLSWGVDEGDMIGYRWDTLEFNGTDNMTWMPGGDGNGEEQNGNHIEPDENGDDYYDYEDYLVYEGEIFVIHINELTDLTAMEGPPYWNGSISTPRVTSDFDFEFREVGSSDDGPRVWYPLIMTGNMIYRNSVINDFEGIGATVSVSGLTNIINITIDDEYGRESAEWDLTTGIMQGMYYEGEGPDGLTIVAEISLIYHFSPGEPTFVYTDGVSQRYVIDDITNGSRNYLDFGPMGDYDETIPEEERPHFLLYETDVFSVWIEHKDPTTYPYLDQNGEDFVEWMWSAKTSHGYEMRSPLMLSEPGLEMTFEEGPPAFMLMIPVGDAAWWDMLEGIYNSIGYVVTNNEEEFGISTLADTFTVTVRWHKSDGMMSYYYVDGTDQETGNHMTWEMHRGITVDFDSFGWNWGVGVGSTMEFEFLEIDVAGENFMEFGPDSTTVANVGDIITVTFKEFGDLSIEEGGGPWALEDMEVNGAIMEYQTEMQEPGFEFADFMEDGENGQGGGPPFAYHVIPVGNAAYWDLLETMWDDEAGYTVIQDSSTFELIANWEGDYVKAEWSKDTGLLQYYKVDRTREDGSRELIVAQMISEDISTPTTSETDDSEGSPGLSYGNTTYIALPFLAIATITIRRKRK